VIQVVSKAASPEAASALRVLKKAAAAQLAEQRVAGTGWVPEVLRTVAVKGAA
jgi:ParB family transcriptional regulator, chromosome partitioning protein